MMSLKPIKRRRHTPQKKQKKTHTHTKKKSAKKKLQSSPKKIQHLKLGLVYDCSIQALVPQKDSISPSYPRKIDFKQLLVWGQSLVFSLGEEMKAHSTSCTPAGFQQKPTKCCEELRSAVIARIICGCLDQG